VIAAAAGRIRNDLIAWFDSRAKITACGMILQASRLFLRRSTVDEPIATAKQDGFMPLSQVQKGVLSSGDFGVSNLGLAETRGFPGFVKKKQNGHFFCWTVPGDSPKTRPTRRGRTKRTAPDGAEGGQPTALQLKSFSDLPRSIRTLVSLLRHRYIARLCRAKARVRDVACAVSAD